MEPMVITKSEARKIILHAAGLASHAQFGTGKEAVYRVIDHLGFVQLDTNFVVQRAHHHTLAARVPDYEESWLSELVDDGRIFEYFIQEAGYIPMKDFCYSLNIKKSFASQRRAITKAEENLMHEILDRVQREGPLMVTDFDNDRIEASTGWWDWRPAKVALEWLYMDGRLTIGRTKSFKKVYDLPENAIPDVHEMIQPSDEEFAKYIIYRTIAALGIASLKEIAFRARRIKGNLIKSELEKMVAAGALRVTSVEGVKTPALYLLPEQQIVPQISGDAFILSPFDVVNVFRHRLKDFFNFDYQLECFVPAAKRKFGYFSLPILIGETFVARMDAKADRKRKVLIVHNLHFEDIVLSGVDLEKLIEAMKNFVQFNNCHDIVINRSNQEEYLNVLLKALS